MNNTPFIPDNPWLKQSKLRQIFESAPKNAINLGLGQPGEDTPLFIREAAKKALDEKPLGYTLNAGILPLREKLAAEFASSGVKPSQICITAGVQEALFCFFYMLRSPATDILLPDPGFLTYPALVRLNGMNPVYYTLSKEENFRLIADRVLESITPATKAVLIAHPSNPTGSNASEAEMKKLIAGLLKLDQPVWLISDEVYYGMNETPCASVADYINDYPWIVLLRGASKSHNMTGWRLGWAVLPELIVKPYVAAHQYTTTCVSALTQWTFELIRGTKEESEWLKAQSLLYRKKRKRVFDILSDKRALYGGESAFYVMMELSADEKLDMTDEAWVMNTMMQHGVVTTPGSAFGISTGNMVRISCGPVMDELERGLQILRKIL